MNRLFRVGALGLAVAGLAACSSMSGNVARAPAPAPAPGTVTTDGEYMAHVERIAWRRGVEVKWINPPTRRVAANN